MTADERPPTFSKTEGWSDLYAKPLFPETEDWTHYDADLEYCLSLPFFPSPTTMNPIMPIWLVLPNWTKPESYRPFWAIGDPETADFGDDDVLAYAEVEYAP
jgi:hypothetical protein